MHRLARLLAWPFRALVSGGLLALIPFFAFLLFFSAMTLFCLTWQGANHGAEWAYVAALVGFFAFFIGGPLLGFMLLIGCGHVHGWKGAFVALTAFFVGGAVWLYGLSLIFFVALMVAPDGFDVPPLPEGPIYVPSGDETEIRRRADFLDARFGEGTAERWMLFDAPGDPLRVTYGLQSGQYTLHTDCAAPVTLTVRAVPDGPILSTLHDVRLDAKGEHKIVIAEGDRGDYYAVSLELRDAATSAPILRRLYLLDGWQH